MSRSSAVAAVAVALALLFTATGAAATPTISYTISGIVGTNSWYRGSTNGDNVILHWSVSVDATSTNCLAAVTIPGPTTGTTRTCWAQNADGRTTAVTPVIKIDATPPTGLAAHFARKPDFNGWYNHPVSISWSGTDATSGVAGCSTTTYHGPDGGASRATGACIDKAGNRAVGAVGLRYDGTPPTLRQVTEASGVSADVLHWTSTSPSDRVVVRRSIHRKKGRTTVFDGVAGAFTDTKIRSGVEYVYFVQSFDEAGNASKIVATTGLPKILPLRKARFAPRAAPSPILRWPHVRRARYYNVQLFRGSRRIFSAWPTSRQVELSAGWRWSGRRYSLRPARYHWYVWAGFGPRKLAHYRAVGNAEFTIPR